MPVQYTYTSTTLLAAVPVQSLRECTVKLNLTTLLAALPVQSLSACSVQLNLYYPISRTACTQPHCLYSTAKLLLPY